MPDSSQGDSRVADLFVDLGIETVYEESGVIIKKTDRFTKKYFHNFVGEPDLAQTLAVTCCMLEIPFLFTGLQTLKIKETDRIEALKIELGKLGYVLKDREGSILEWDGEKCSPEENPVIKTYDDHRMALAFAPIALKRENIVIEEPMVITKSYRHYWEDLEKAGFEIEKQ
jgi:3-phosphoshikimate 1-carboxyvinyltransferase